MKHLPRSQQPAQSHSGAHPAPRDFSRPANQPYLESALQAAETRSYRAAVRFGLSHADREDLQQAVLVDLLERASQFDPSKGSAGTFTGLVSAHRSARFLKDLKKDRCRLRNLSAELLHRCFCCCFRDSRTRSFPTLVLVQTDTPTRNLCLVTGGQGQERLLPNGHDTWRHPKS
jgi:hypothetical protein